MKYHNLKKVSQYNEISFFIAMLGISQNWDYKPKIECCGRDKNQNNHKKTTII